MIKKRTLALATLSILAGAFPLAAQSADWPAPIKALEKQGIEVVGSFDAPGGLTGYAGLVDQQPVVVYVTADGQHAIVGPMIDGRGANLSQQPLEKLVGKPMTERIWKALEGSTWIRDGKSSAPRVVYAFTDPNCPYCNKFWNDARPWVDAGKVQIRHVIVGILGPTSPGKAAALLGAKNPEAALAQHEKTHAQGGVKPLATIPAKARAQLSANGQLMQQLGAQATPTIYYRDERGLLQQVQGAPSPQALGRIMGPR